MAKKEIFAQIDLFSDLPKEDLERLATFDYSAL